MAGKFYGVNCVFFFYFIELNFAKMQYFIFMKSNADVTTPN